MEILELPLKLSNLKAMAENSFGDLVKAVVDVDRGVLAIDAELHSDLESLLLSNGSFQDNLWGINFYPELDGDSFLEFDSMINIRPSQSNMSRGVDDESVRRKIVDVVNRFIVR